jgi:hypothetical protein
VILVLSLNGRVRSLVVFDGEWKSSLFDLRLNQSDQVLRASPMLGLVLSDMVAAFQRLLVIE